MDEIDRFSNVCSEEPTRRCPVCNEIVHAEWVDIGFGPYSAQVSPYMCDNCNWCEQGCQSCIEAKCFSWDSCKGRAVITTKINEERIIPPEK